MDKQPTPRRRANRAAARTLAVAATIAALVATLGAGQTLAAEAVPDERILERQGMIDYHTAAIRQALAAEAVPDERILERQARIDHQPTANQADEQGQTDKPARGPSTQFPRRFFKPEPPMDTGPRLDADQQAVPAPPPPAATGHDGLVIGLAVAALLLAAVAATTWRIHHHRPRPEPTT